MEDSMLGNGQVELGMVKENILSKMDLVMKGSGKMEMKTEWEI